MMSSMSNTSLVLINRCRFFFPFKAYMHSTKMKPNCFELYKNLILATAVGTLFGKQTQSQRDSVFGLQ